MAILVEKCKTTGYLILGMFEQPTPLPLNTALGRPECYCNLQEEMYTGNEQSQKLHT